MLVYGQAGAGKTTLIRTLPKPLILSSEAGLLSLSESTIPYIEVNNFDDLKESFTWLKSSDEAKKFESVALDSISEVAEVVLAYEMSRSKDGRAAYGEMNTIMINLIRGFRDIQKKNVLFTTKLEKAQDETGRILYSPSMPGKTLTQQIPYFFDEVMALRVEKDSEGRPCRALLCNPDGLWTAKDRSGVLSDWEGPDLGALISKISGDKK